MSGVQSAPPGVASPGPTTGNPSPRRARTWVYVAGVLTVAALIAGGVVLAGRDDSDDDRDEASGGDDDETSDSEPEQSSTSEPAATTTTTVDTTTTVVPPAGSTLDVKSITLAADPIQALPDRFEFTPNEEGVTALEIISDAATGSGVFSIERQDSTTATVTPIENGFAVHDPDQADVAVVVRDGSLEISWIDVDGAEGSVVHELDADQSAKIGTPPTPVFSRAAATTQAAPAQVPSGIEQAPLAPYTISNVARITSSWEPATARVRVLPDPAYCQNLPVPSVAGIENGFATCSGAWAPPATTLIFRASVTAHLLSIEDLNSEEATRLRAQCEARLNAHASLVSFGEFVFGVAGVVASLLPTTAIPARAVTAIGGVGFVLDSWGRIVDPSSVADPCAREVQVRLLDGESADYVRTLAFDVPLVVTPLDPTFEVVEQSGPVAVQPFPGSGAGVVGGTFTFRLAQSVGTGDFQAKLTWTGDSDMDLHVIDPSGEEIFYSHLSSASGGQLDRDEIPVCGDLARHAESAFWPTGGAPSGTYQIFVVNFRACDDQPHTATIEPIVLGVSFGAQTFTIAPGEQSEAISVVVP